MKSIVIKTAFGCLALAIFAGIFWHQMQVVVKRMSEHNARNYSFKERIAQYGIAVKNDSNLILSGQASDNRRSR